MPPDKIRRLYESDARGLLDEDLLDEAGHAIYARCADLLELAEANRGRVKCRDFSFVKRWPQARSSSEKLISI